MSLTIQWKEHEVIIDEEDKDLFFSRSWGIHKKSNTCYLRYRHSGKKLSLFFHRELMKASLNYQIDHINGNGLDNRKSNLRICAFSDNMKNNHGHKKRYSKFKGAFYRPKLDKWVSMITKDRKQYYLGLFKTEQEAAKAYNEAALIYHGNFANINQFVA
jgi:hypothetical protein